MTLKEKLELLWKYLLLAVIFFGVTQLSNSPQTLHEKHMKEGGHYGKKVIWYDDMGGEDMDIDVDIEKIVAGDSTITITINGETMDLDDLDDLGGKVIVKSFKDEDDGHQKQIKVIKKKIKTD